MSKRFAIPNNPPRAGNKRPAPGIPTGDVTGRLNTPHPYNPASKKNDVAAMYPANLESLPNHPKLAFCIHFGKSNLVVSVAIRRKDIDNKTQGSAPRNESYQPNSGPNAILAATINGSERNSPNWLPLAEYATPLGALPERSIL